MNLVHTFPSNFAKIHSNIILPMYATRAANLILFDLITVMFVGDYKRKCSAFSVFLSLPFSYVLMFSSPYYHTFSVCDILPLLLEMCTNRIDQVSISI